MKKTITATMAVVMMVAMGASAALIDLAPDADIDIRSADLADNGYNRTTLWVVNANADPSAARCGKAYIRYELPTLGAGESIVGATFEITRAVIGAWNFTYEVSGMDDGIAGEADWVEGGGTGYGTTWNNAPANITTSAYQFSDSSVVGTFQVANAASGGAAGDTHSITGTDLLNFINADNNGYVTLMIGRPGVSTSSEQFASRSNATYAAPTLTLDIIPEPATLGLILTAGLGLIVIRKRMVI